MINTIKYLRLSPVFIIMTHSWNSSQIKIVNTQLSTALHSASFIFTSKNCLQNPICVAYTDVTIKKTTKKSIPVSFMYIYEGHFSIMDKQLMQYTATELRYKWVSC